MDTNQPAEPVLIEVTVPGLRREVVSANLFRPDLGDSLRKDHPDATGYHAFRLQFNPPLPVYDTCSVTVRAKGAERPLAGGTATLHGVGRHPKGQRDLSPILVTSTGRAGTTLLMRRLGGHPEIVVTPHYPYEIKLLSYYSTAFRTLVSDADRQNSSHPDRLRINRFFIGFNPYNARPYYNVAADQARIEAFFADSVPRHLAGTFRDLIREYYDIVRASQEKGAARYFAEKTDVDTDMREAPRRFFETVREIVLLRDPRDILCSSKAFWQQPEGDLLGSLRNAATTLSAIHAERRADTLFLKYEDLVRDEAGVLERVARFLDLRAPFAPAREHDAALFKAHGTSDSPAGSIGRWRRDLNERTIGLCAELFGPFLDTFGYPR